MKVLDGKMIAFQVSALAIDPPDATLVAQVKQLTAQVAVLVARDQAIQAWAVPTRPVALRSKAPGCVHRQARSRSRLDHLKARRLA